MQHYIFFNKKICAKVDAWIEVSTGTPLNNRLRYILHPDYLKRNTIIQERTYHFHISEHVTPALSQGVNSYLMNRKLEYFNPLYNSQNFLASPSAELCIIIPTHRFSGYLSTPHVNTFMKQRRRRQYVLELYDIATQYVPTFFPNSTYVFGPSSFKCGSIDNGDTDDFRDLGAYQLRDHPNRHIVTTTIKHNGYVLESWLNNSFRNIGFGQKNIVKVTIFYLLFIYSYLTSNFTFIIPFFYLGYIC
jgi:hypothetical protein